MTQKSRDFLGTSKMMSGILPKKKKSVGETAAHVRLKLSCGDDAADFRGMKWSPRLLRLSLPAY